MIIYKFKEIPETRGEKYPCSAFRWVFETGMWHIGFVWQYKNKSNGEWESSHTTVYEVWLDNKFRFGREHYYYDGPHCMLHLGWITFCWCGNPFTKWCEKCWPSDN